MQRADAAIANRIVGNVERGAEIACQWSVNDGFQALFVEITQRLVKETGPHSPVGFNYRRHPRRVAERRLRFLQTELDAKVSRNAAQLFRCFDDEAAFPFLRGKINQRFDLRVQCVEFP